jgi:serine protease inhibitor
LGNTPSSAHFIFIFYFSLIYSRLVAVNAVYFLGKWEKPFEVEETVALPFYVGGANQQQPPLTVSCS